MARNGLPPDVDDIGAAAAADALAVRSDASARLSSLLSIPSNEADVLVKDALDALGVSLMVADDERIQCGGHSRAASAKAKAIELTVDDGDDSDGGGGGKDDGPAAHSSFPSNPPGRTMEEVLEIAVSAYFSRSAPDPPVDNKRISEPAAGPRWAGGTAASRAVSTDNRSGGGSGNGNGSGIGGISGRRSASRSSKKSRPSGARGGRPRMTIASYFERRSTPREGAGLATSTTTATASSTSFPSSSSRSGIERVDPGPISPRHDVDENSRSRRRRDRRTDESIALASIGNCSDESPVEKNAVACDRIGKRRRIVAISDGSAAAIDKVRSVVVVACTDERQGEERCRGGDSIDIRGSEVSVKEGGGGEGGKGKEDRKGKGTEGRVGGALDSAPLPALAEQSEEDRGICNSSKDKNDDENEEKITITGIHKNEQISWGDASDKGEYALDFLSPSFDAKQLANSYRTGGGGSNDSSSPPFLHLAKALAQVCSTTKRLEKERVLTNLLLTFLYHDRSAVSTTSQLGDNTRGGSALFGRSCALHAVLLAGNAAFSGLTLNIGQSAISHALCSALSCSAARLREKVGTAGEMGDAAADIMSGNDGRSSSASMGDGAGGPQGGGGMSRKQQTRLAWGTRTSVPLKVSDVVDAIASLHALGRGSTGNNSNSSNNNNKGIEAKRKECLIKVFAAARHHEELRFVVKIFCAHIRTGATLITVLRSLSGAHVLHALNASNADCARSAAAVAAGGGASKPSSAKHLRKSAGKHLRNDEDDDNDDRRAAAAANDDADAIKPDIVAAQEKLRIAYALRHDLKACVGALVRHGTDGLDGIDVVAGVPMQPMLAGPSRGVDDVVSHYFEHFHERSGDGGGGGGGQVARVPFFTAEYKYDGQRAQIHCLRGDDGADSGDVTSIRVFSRHLDEMTEKFGSLVESLKGSKKWPRHVRSFIIDAEICAVKQIEESGEVVILPFQVLSTMRRVAGIGSELCADNGTNLNVCIFAFDMMFFNGMSLVKQPLMMRRKMMKEHLLDLTENECFEFAKSIDVSFRDDETVHSDDVSAASTKVDEFLREAIGPGRCEGLMLKSLHSLYTSHESREKSGGFGGWRKLKKDYIDSLADSIDVVPIGAWRGNGRKSKWFSPFLLAVYSPETGELQSLCRCMSGFSDGFYEAKNEFYSARIVDNKPDNVSTDENPTFWFEPSEVWEIRGADLTLSPVHHAAKGLLDGSCDVDFDEPRGISLRFPRFIRERSDKSIDDATTHTQILNLFTQQAQRQNCKEM